MKVGGGKVGETNDQPTIVLTGEMGRVLSKLGPQFSLKKMTEGVTTTDAGSLFQYFMVGPLLLRLLVP